MLINSTNCLSKPARLVAPYSWVGHIPFVMWLIERHKPVTVVELGVHTGNSFFSMCQTAKSLKLSTKLHGVDTWEGEQHAGTYDESVWLDVSQYAADTYPDQAVLHRSYFDDALKLFADQSVDLLHIDGLHTYEAVKHDFDTWKHKLNSRAVVLFHDVAEKRDDFGVHQLWGELSREYQTITFTHSHGLGVLFFGAETIDLRAELLACSSEYSTPLTQQFAVFGEALAKQVLNIPTQPIFWKPKIFKATIYLGSGEHPIYSEELALRANFDTSGVSELGWLLPDDYVVSHIRIDLATEPCQLDILRLELCDHAGDSIWTLRDLEDIYNCSDIQFITPSSQATGEHHLLCTGDDPQFQLQLPVELQPLPQNTRLRIVLRAYDTDNLSSNIVLRRLIDLVLDIEKRELENSSRLQAEINSLRSLKEL